MISAKRKNRKWRAAVFLAGFALLGGSFFLNLTPEEEKLRNAVKEVSIHPLAHRQEYRDVLALQEAFVRNAKSIRPAVVSINKVKEIRRKPSRFAPHSRGSDSLLLKLKDWLITRIAGKRYLVESVGSGILLDSRGHILTNNHVIENIQRILVKLSDNREFTARTVGVDSETDLAVIKIFSWKSLPTPPFGQSANLEVGDWVMAIGNPYGLEGTVTVGVVSGKSRQDLGITTFENFIQTDASINPGNSGGPLINLDGNIVGINTAVAAIGAGVGFAIPVEMALKVAWELIEKGSVERGWLGVGVQALTPELATSFNASHGNKGVLVNSVEAATPAKDAGIRRGDIIIQFDQEEVSNSKKFKQLVAMSRIGKVVPVKILRDGKEKILHIRIGKYSS